MLMTPPSVKLRLKILSDPANLAAVRLAVESLCLQNGMAKKASDEVGLCLNEAMANVIRHAYGGAANQPIEITAEYRDDAVRIAIRDWGNGVNPESLPPQPYDPLQPGGLGLICLKQMMTEVKFTPQPDGMLLEMTRSK
jgi:anti-sigma regulatory factor (Ser/Thr protein kinase)